MREWSSLLIYDVQTSFWARYHDPEATVGSHVLQESVIHISTFIIPLFGMTWPGHVDPSWLRSLHQSTSPIVLHSVELSMGGQKRSSKYIDHVGADGTLVCHHGSSCVHSAVKLLDWSQRGTIPLRMWGWFNSYSFRFLIHSRKLTLPKKNKKNKIWDMLVAGGLIASWTLCGIKNQGFYMSGTVPC